MPSTPRQPQRILISGSHGFLGRHIVAARRALGDQVIPLLRSPAPAAANTWDTNSDLDPAAVSGFDAVIHLAGEPIANARWTAAKRRRIWQSRITGTQRLARALAAAPRPPKTFLCASGINIYGNRGDTIVDETTPAGHGFLPDVCIAWESAANLLAPLARVVPLRIGVVLDPSGGALAQLLPLFRLGLGGSVAGGHNWLSWITLADLVAATNHALDSTTLQGPINISTPHPVTARHFAATLAASIHRLAVLPIPAWSVRLALGQLAQETILSSVRALPLRLTQDVFTFQHPTLPEALSSMLHPLR